MAMMTGRCVPACHFLRAGQAHCPEAIPLACLAADEMGLGKTLQTISLLSFLKFERNVQVG